MAHLTRPAEISGVSAGLFPETAAGNRAYRSCSKRACKNCMILFCLLSPLGKRREKRDGDCWGF